MVSLESVDVSEGLLPRRYQEEIFARAQEGNIIAALDTGSGKTFISILLMKWIAARQSAGEKKVVFLVPKVALVEQQADFIAKHTPLRVSRYYGSMALDLSDRDRWKKEFQGADVLVMTAQIFLNIITHSHWSMEKVSLMIFDECHHTRKNHAYNGIMREYFQWAASSRPKIFGMTASPIWNPKDAADSLSTLERNMHAKVIAVRDHTDELTLHLPKPNEVIVEYPLPPASYPTFPSRLIRDSLDMSILPVAWDIPHEKILSRYEVTLQSIGPYGAELYLYTEMRERMYAVIAERKDDAPPEFVHPKALYQTHYNGHQDGVAKRSEQVQYVERLLNKFSPLFADGSDPSMPASPVPLEWCTPQVEKLTEILLKNYKEAFQGIVFVEQRHVAMSLAKLLPRIPELNGKIRSAELVGHGGQAASKNNIKGMAVQSQQDVVKAFRDGEVNILVATSVAEEGLDFPACDIVIRYDPIQHMVGYVQSRGRARHKSSTFVVMVQQGRAEDIARYRNFSESEPQLKEFYQLQNSRDVVEEEEPEEGEIEEDDPDDLATRERYVVKNTGAILTYNTAVGLLNNLCAMIPRDKFTPVQLPVYSGEFESVIELPSSLPLPPRHLKFQGPLKNSKKEAKRAVAFLAVKILHLIGVFDDFLLPAKGVHGGGNEDGDGRVILDPSDIPDTLTARVRDPWTIGEKLYLHVVYINGDAMAGLVTGTMLPDVLMTILGDDFQLGRGARIIFEASRRQRRLLEAFTRMGIWWTVSGRLIRMPVSCYMVPIRPADNTPDWELMERAIEFPYGSEDWSAITEDSCGHMLCMNIKEYGRPLLLKSIHPELTPLSKPGEGSREAGFETYKDFFIDKYTRKGIPPVVPDEGPLVVLQPFPRKTSARYYIHSANLDIPSIPHTVPNAVILPQAFVRWVDLPEGVFRAYHALPVLMHRITDLYRIQQAKQELSLPPIIDNLLIEAFTLPSSSAGYSNQRFETLGDSVLKLGVVVHVLNKFPHRHEGQLDILRRNSVANRTLMSRARDIGLQRFLSPEPMSLRTWRHTLPAGMDPLEEPTPEYYTIRQFPRKSLQDCMESCLGAAYIAGGMDMAIRTAESLGLCFGGPLPWPLRYSRPPEPTPVASLFHQLQEKLGYEFHRGEILLEAVTHPSFRSTAGSSYQRLEFLGDALIDLVVTDYLFRTYPQATSGQMSWARSRAVCTPALASVAIRTLGLHKVLLINNTELSMVIGRYVPIFEEIPHEEIITKGWKYDPPKALADVLESVLGAVLVDTAYNLDKTMAVVEFVMADTLAVISPQLAKDPISELMIWAARAGCRKISFRKSQSAVEVKRNDAIAVICHDVIVAGPITAGNMSLAKGLASEHARSVLETPGSKWSLATICDCNSAIVVDPPVEVQVAKPVPVAANTEEDAPLVEAAAPPRPSDETVEGFATIAQWKLQQDQPPEDKAAEEEQEEDEADEMEVDELLGGSKPE